ncbi:MAG: peptidylprolyl isomerase [Clostridia bacterium]|nr:peptidylprolyl isomerase [Clostridia bacterium]
MNQTAYLYQMYGLPFDAHSTETRRNALEQAIDGVIAERVIQQRGAALGLDRFTDEELAELEPKVQAEWDQYVGQARTQFFADSELEGDELTEAITAQLAELEITRETALKDVKAVAIAERVRQHAIQDVAVTPEEVAAEYQSRVDEQRALYAEDPTAYASDRMNGQTIYFVPAGYRYVKHVLLRTDAETSGALDAMESELNALTTTRLNLQGSLSELEPPEAEPADGEPAPEPEPLTEEEAALRAETVAQLRAQIAELDEEIAAKQAELTAAQADAFDALALRVAEVQAKIELGLNFDRVIETYGEDPGMATEPFRTMGYPVTDGLAIFDPAFQDAAMALAQAGDVSEPVQTSFGFHIIKYVADSQEHEIGLEAVAGDIAEALLTNRQEEAYQQARDQWIGDTKVRRFNNRMDFI